AGRPLRGGGSPGLILAGRVHRPRNAPPLPKGERVGGRGVKVVRVAIADDQAMVRAGFRLIVQSQKDMQVAGEAADGQEAIDLVRRERPDVVLMDIRMPRVDGIAATREIAGITRVVILTTFELDEYVFDALAAGASAFLLKAAPPEDLIRAIRVVAEGDAL